MIETVLFILGMTTLALMLKDRFKIPMPLSILPMAFLIGQITGHNLIDVNEEGFDQILLTLLPVLIAADVLAIHFEDVKKNALSLFYVAVISVVMSILLGAYLGGLFLTEHNIPFLYMVMLFCMITATDPVAVINVLSSNKLPHKLTFLAEGESLANDATALIVFGLCTSLIIMQSDPEMTAMKITEHSILVVVGAVVVGLVIGGIGLITMSFTRNKVAETAIILMVAYGAFEAAELFHWSGILAIIVSVMTANTVISRRMEQDEHLIRDTEDRYL